MILSLDLVCAFLCLMFYKCTKNKEIYYIFKMAVIKFTINMQEDQKNTSFKQKQKLEKKFFCRAKRTEK